MPTTTDNAVILSVVQALYESTGKGDFDTAEEYLTDDFFVTEAGTVPFAGTYRGRGALRELYTHVMSVMDVAGLEVHAITVGDDHAVGLLDLVLPGKPETRIQIAEMFRFRDGKCCEIRPYYFDPTPVHAAVAAKRNSSGQ